MHHPHRPPQDLDEVVDLDQVAAWTALRAREREIAAAQPGRWQQLRNRARQRRAARQERRASADPMASGPRLLERLLGLPRPAPARAWTASQTPTSDGQTPGTDGRSTP